MDIRKFRWGDLTDVVNICNESLIEKYTGDFLIYLWQMNPDGFLVYERDGKVIGFIIATLPSLSEIRILMLAVDRKRRNQRIGSTLLSRVIHSFPTARTVSLEVRTDNLDAIDFYKRNGFVIKEKISCFYTDNSAAFVMRKQLG